MNKIKKKTAPVTSVQGSMMTLDDIGLPAGVIYAPHAISGYVRTLLQNWRQGTVWSRGRADVSFSNKKPWKQKGTGRARAGSPKSPLWRGGGVIFGPQARTRVLKTNKKMRQFALLSLLSDYIKRNAITVIENGITGDKPSTVQAHTILMNHGLLGKKVTLFITPGDMLQYASFMNIPNVAIINFDQPNAYDLMRSAQWVVFKKDVELFKEMVAQWL